MSAILRENERTNRTKNVSTKYNRYIFTQMFLLKSQETPIIVQACKCSATTGREYLAELVGGRIFPINVSAISNKAGCYGDRAQTPNKRSGISEKRESRARNNCDSARQRTGVRIREAEQRKVFEFRQKRRGSFENGGTALRQSAPVNEEAQLSLSGARALAGRPRVAGGPLEPDAGPGTQIQSGKLQADPNTAKNTCSRIKQEVIDKTSLFSNVVGGFVFKRTDRSILARFHLSAKWRCETVPVIFYSHRLVVALDKFKQLGICL